MRSTILFSAVSDVTVRFPEYITEVREFFVQNGLPVSTTQAVALLADRVAQDDTFREDLTSMLRVVCTGEPGISYLELLGLLLVAAEEQTSMAAPPSGAEEENARRLFNAVVEMRRSIVTPRQEPFSEDLHEASEPDSDYFTTFDEPAPPTPFTTPQSTPSGHSTGMHERLSRALALAADQDTFGSRAEAHLGDCALGRVQEAYPIAALESPIPAEEHEASAPVARATSVAEASVVPRAPTGEPEFFRAILPAPTNSQGRIYAVGCCALLLGIALGAGVDRYATTHAGPSLPSNAASTTSNAAPLPNAAPATHNAYGLRHPLPRQPVAAASPDPGSAQVLPATKASNLPPGKAQSQDAVAAAVPSRPRVAAGNNASAAAGSNRLVAAVAPPASAPVRPIRLNAPDLAATDTRLITGRGPGRVTLGSAGIMAANLVSSPAPLYPAQASAAQVQGEVIIEAIVGRDGEVVDTRVISGPPLLREAARSAVGRWRYRPYEVDGTPTEIATTARVDFRLNAD